MATNNDAAKQMEPTEAAGNGRAGKVAIAIALIAPLCAGVVGGYLLAPSPQTQSTSAALIEGSSESTTKEKSGDLKKVSSKSKHKKKNNKKNKKSKSKKNKEKEHIGIQGLHTFVSGDTAFVEFPPLTVSIRSRNSTRHVKIGIVIETTPQASETIALYSYYIIDTVNTYLRTIDITKFEDPTMLAILKERIAHRTRIVAPDAIINEVLITEFLLT